MKSLFLALLLLTSSVAMATPAVDEVTSRTGDLDMILKQRQLRVLVVYDNANFYLEQGAPDGLTVAMMREFERWLDNRYFNGQKLKMHLAFLPVRYDELLPLLQEGKGDLAVASLYPTEERSKLADFSVPDLEGLQEWVVSAKGREPLHNLRELSGKRIWVRKSSSYYDSLLALNQMLASLSLPPVIIQQADEALQDSDLLEMVSQGEIAYTVTDSHKARLWSKAFTGLQMHSDVPLRRNSFTAWAMRKESPLLQEVVNSFLAEFNQDSRRGAPLYRRYLEDGRGLARRFQRATPEQMGWKGDEYQRYATLFRRYGEQYDIDWLMLMAQAYQESTLDQKARSHRGAVGVMQVLPSTARELKVGNIRSLENNVHAGTKYMRYMIDNYFDDEAVDEENRALFALAAYNAGPNRIARLRQEATRRGLNGNVWFGNVERVAAARVGSETVQYVKKVSSRYLAYRHSYEQIQQKQRVRPR